MELEPRTAAPVHATGAVEFVPLAAVADDVTFRLREEGDVALLAASIGRLGQLSPIELRPIPGAPEQGPRYQVVAGFRRLAALRMLMRERVLARVHRTLDDADAWGLALSQALLTEPLDYAALARLRDALAAGAVAPWADELLEEALVRAPVEPELREKFLEFLGAPADAAGDGPEGEARVDEELADEAARPDDAPGGAAADEAAEGEPAEVEVTPEELVADLGRRLYEVNADLAVAFEAWRELPGEGRREILAQARWIAALLPHLEREDEGSEG